MLSNRFNFPSELNDQQEETETDFSVDESTNTESIVGACTINAIKDSLILDRHKTRDHCLSHKQIKVLKLPPIGLKSKKEDMDNIIKGLPSDWVVQKKKSKVIEKLLRKKETEHEITLETMREKMSEVNSNIEDEIRLLGNLYKQTHENYLKDINESMNNLRASYQNESQLKQEHFDKTIKEIQDNYKNESNKIYILIQKLKLQENQRIEQFKVFVQVAYKRLNEICFKTPFEIHEFFVQEIQDINEITLNNLRHYESLRLKLCLNLENETRIKLQEIELVKLNWMNYIKLSVFSTLNEQNTFEEQQDSNKKIRLDPKFIDFIKNSKIDLNLGELNEWINKIQCVIQQIDWCSKDIISSFKTAVQSIFKSYFDDMKAIAEKILKLGVVGENPTEEVFKPEIYCSKIADLGRKFQKMLKQLQLIWDNISNELYKELQITFIFLNTFTNLWESHLNRINEAKVLVLKEIKNNVEKSHLDLANEETNINISLDTLRQESNEKNLDVNLGKINKYLDNLNKLYNGNYEKECKLVDDKLMHLINIEIQLHKAEITNFLSINEPLLEKDLLLEEEEINQEDNVNVLQKEINLCNRELEDLKSWRVNLYSIIEEYLKNCDEQSEKSAKVWIEIQREKFSVRRKISQDILHKSRGDRIKPVLYDIRLVELKEHNRRFEQHKAAIEKETENFTQFFNEYEPLYDKEIEIFLEKSDEIKSKLPNAENCNVILSEIVLFKMLSDKYTKKLTNLDESFKQKCNDNMGKILKSNLDYINAMKTFQDGGNFNTEEIKIISTELSKLEKGINKKLSGVFKQSSGKLQKSLGKLASVQSTTNNLLEQYKTELEYQDTIIITLKDIHSEIGREAYLLKCHRKSVFGLIEQIKERSQQLFKGDSKIQEFKRLIQVMLEEIAGLKKKFLRPQQEIDGKFIHLNSPNLNTENLIFSFEPNQDEENFLGKSRILIHKSFKSIQEISKKFYDQTKSFITKDKILPTYEEFISENLPKYIYYYIQCELFWFEELTEFLNKLNETITFVKTTSNNFMSVYKKSSMEEIKEIHRMIIKRIEEVNNEQKEAYKKIYNKLLALHGHPNNKPLLDGLCEEMNHFVEEWKDIFTSSLEFCTCDLEEMQIIYKSTFEDLLILVSELTNRFNQEIQIEKLYEEHLKGKEFLETFSNNEINFENNNNKIFNSKSKVIPSQASITLNNYRSKVSIPSKYKLNVSLVQKNLMESDGVLSGLSENEDSLKDVLKAVNLYEVERLKIILALQRGDEENLERLEGWKNAWYNEIEQVKKLYTVKYDLTKN